MSKDSSKTSSPWNGSTMSAESMKVIAESIGVGTLPDDAANELAEDVSMKIKRIVQDAAKFMRHGKRDTLLVKDIEMSLKVHNIQPENGFVDKEDSTPFRLASGSCRELYFTEDKEIDLSDLITAKSSTKIPFDVTLHSHWFIVDGVQPNIAENPTPLPLDSQLVGAANAVTKLDHGLNGQIFKQKLQLKNVETVHVKPLAMHELSVEQQLFYKDLTEACVGSDERRRVEALQSIGSDPGLHELLPRMCTFISEGVKVNVVQNNLALLIYLMRMVRSLLDNRTLLLEKYLHQLIPSVMTCIVSKQLCIRPEFDNHWALRDFGARLIANICKSHNTISNNVQTRVTRIFGRTLLNDKRKNITHLSSLYGSIVGLSALGDEVIQMFIIPRLTFISERIETHLLSSIGYLSKPNKIAANKIRAVIHQFCPPIIMKLRHAPDTYEDYKNDFGFLGISLCRAVARMRLASTPAMPYPSSINNNKKITATTTKRVSKSSYKSEGFRGVAAFPEKPSYPLPKPELDDLSHLE